MYGIREEQCNFSLYFARQSHNGTAVPEYFKDDNSSKWKSGKFNPRSPKTLRLIVTLCKISSRFDYPFCPPPKYAKIRMRWLG